MMRWQLFFAGLVIAVGLCSVSATPPGMVYSSDVEGTFPKPPRADVQCEVCQAVLQNSITKLKEAKYNKQKKGMRDVAITEILNDACSNSNFRVYEFSPPQMSKACDEFMGDYEEKVEEFLIKGTDELEARKQLCLKKKKKGKKKKTKGFCDPGNMLEEKEKRKEAEKKAREEQRAAEEAAKNEKEEEESAETEEQVKEEL